MADPEVPSAPGPGRGPAGCPPVRRLRPDLRAVFGLRNSVKAADYDHRAFDSWIPLQRYWQRGRFRIIRGSWSRGPRVLDIGCGSSRIVQRLPQAVGMDMQLRKLRWLRAPGRELLQANMNDLPFADGCSTA